MKRYYSKFIISVIAIILFMIPFALFAAADLGLDGAQNIGLGDNDLKGIITNIINIALGFLGLIAVVFILYAGFMWMTAGGNADRVDRAKKILIRAIIGLIIILSAFAIATFVINSITDATGFTDGNSPGGGPGGTVGGTEANLIVRNWQPYDGATDTARNILVRVYFNKIIDESTVTSSDFTFTSSADNSAVNFQLSVVGSRIDIEPLIACDEEGADYCLGNTVNYSVSIANASIKSLDDKTLVCTTGCSTSFTTGANIDLTPPEVSLFTPQDNDTFSVAADVSLEAQATDDSGVVAGMTFLADNEEVLPTGTDGAEPWIGLFSTAAYDEGDSIDVSATAEDLSGNIGYSREVDIRILPAHCFNQVRDEDETGVDCGGSCGGCLGDSCDNNPAANICEPNDSLCGQGICNLDCICALAPVISNISPDNGAEGNYITITGDGFGSSEGSVVFLGSASSGDEVTANIAACVSAWSPWQVIVEVPEGIVSGGIKIITSGGDFDTTLDNRGWQGDFIVNSTIRPGICGIAPEAGTALSNITITGTQFGDNKDTVMIGGIGVTSSDIDSWTDGNIISLIPNLQPGKVSVAVKVADELSNPINYEVIRDVLIPSISYLEPDNGPVGTYITIHGNNFGFAEGDILVNFINGEDIMPADIDFPAMCGEYSVDNEEIVVKVPEGVSLGEWSLVIIRDLRESLPASFNVTDDILSPGLCLLEPNNGPVGTLVDAYGEGFAATGQFSFWDNIFATILNWTSGHIGTQVPGGANTGPIQIISGDGGFSNTINFSVGSCDANSCNIGDECCSDGICRETGACIQNIGADEYLWSFTTGQQLPPFIVEDVWPQCEEACINTMIGVQFSNPVDEESLNDLSVAVKQCTDANCSAYINEVDYTEGDVSIGYYDDTNYILSINPDGNLQTEGYYRVILKSGSLGIVNTEGGYLENMNFSSTGGEQDSYSWIFRTGIDECTLDRVEALPEEYTIISQDERLNMTGYPFSEPDDCSPRGQMLDPSEYSWLWESTNVSTATVTSAFNEAIITPVWGNPAETSITATADGVMGSSQITVAMDIPRIDSISPDNGRIDENLKTLVTVHGANFGDEQGSTLVLVGGEVAEIADCSGSWSNTQIVIQMPLSTSDQDTIKIIKTGGSDESNPFTVNSIIRPAVCSISPNFGSEETRVTLTGYNFGDEQREGNVFFDQLGVNEIDSWSNTKIKTRVPVGSATGPVVVNVLGNDSNSVIFSLDPHIDSLSPDNGSVNSYVTISGRNFGNEQGDGYVLIGGERSYLAPCIGGWNNNSIIVQIPGSLSLGNEAVQVITHYGIGSNEVDYEINEKPVNPLLCEINPDWAAVNQSVNISGDNFGNGLSSDLIFTNNVSVASSSWGDQSIVASIIEDIKSGPVSIAREFVVGQQCAGFHIGSWCPGDIYEDIIEIVESNSVDFFKGCVIGTTSSREEGYIPTVAENSEAVGTLATDGTYLYGKSWSSYDEADNVISIIGTGYNGTVLGEYYGDLARVSGSITMTYYPDGYLYNGYSLDGHSLQRVNVSTGTVDDDSMNIPAGLLNRNTGEMYSSARGDNLITSDGTYVYNLAFGTRACPDNHGSRCYDGFKVRVFDPMNNWELVREWVSGPDSFYTDGIVADSKYIYAFQWGGQHKVRMMDIVTGEFIAEWISEQGNSGSDGSGNDIISGQYDWVNDRVWLGDLVDHSRAPGPAYIYKYTSCNTYVPDSIPMPYVIDNNSCTDNNVQSPSPYKNIEGICTNSSFSATFNTIMDETSFTDNNIKIFECGIGDNFDSNTCSGQLNFTFDNLTFFNTDQGNGFVIDTDGLLANGTWYQVNLTADIITPSGLSLEPYSWYFKTGEGECELSHVSISPADTTVYVGNEQEYSSLPFGAHCEILPPNDFVYTWSSSNETIATTESSNINMNLVAAIGSGETNIQATTLGVSGLTSLTVIESPNCGDGFVQIDLGEQCDDGNTSAGDGCSIYCQSEIIIGGSCGDGIVQWPNSSFYYEQCDDNNTSSGDGCSNICYLENGNYFGNCPSCDNEVIDSQIGTWSMDEGEGNIVASSINNLNDGALVNGGDNWITGMIGDSALQFNGSDEFVTINDPNGNLDLTNQFTLSAWVNSDEFYQEYSITTLKYQGDEGNEGQFNNSISGIDDFININNRHNFGHLNADGDHYDTVARIPDEIYNYDIIIWDHNTIDLDVSRLDRNKPVYLIVRGNRYGNYSGQQLASYDWEVPGYNGNWNLHTTNIKRSSIANNVFIISSDHTNTHADIWCTWEHYSQLVGRHLGSLISVISGQIVTKGSAFGLYMDNDEIKGYVNFAGTLVGQNNIVTASILDGWNYVTLTYDNSNLKLYINGAEENTISYTGNINNNTTPLLMGQFFVGAIDNVKIYNEARSAEDINSSYTSCTIECTGVVTAECNNNFLDDGEKCDYVDGDYEFSGSQYCVDLDGFAEGVLTCTESCEIDTNQCVPGEPASDVCINTEISAEFDSLMNWLTFITGTENNDTVHFEKVTNLCETGPDSGNACSNDSDCADGVDQGKCDLDINISGGLENIPPNDSQYTKLYVYPLDGILDAGSEYRATVKGGVNGVQDVEGFTLESDYVWPFYTGDAECSIDRVEVTPDSYQFNNSEEIVNFTVRAYDENDNIVVGEYGWQVQGDSQLLEGFDSSAQTIQVSATNTGNGELSLRATVDAGDNNKIIDNPVKTIDSNTSSLYPDQNTASQYCIDESGLAGPALWETTSGTGDYYRYIDSGWILESVDAKISQVKCSVYDDVQIDIFMCNVPWVYENETYNFKTRYCRGEGKNFIYNGSFEIDDNSDDMPDTWIDREGDWNNQGTYSMRISNDRTSLLIESEGDDSDENGHWIAATQYVQVKPNTQYTFSGYAKTENARRTPFQVWQRNIIDERIPDTGQNAGLNGTNDWAYYTINILTTSNTHYLEINMAHRSWDDDTSSKTWFDDVQLELGMEATEYESSVLLPSLTLSPDTGVPEGSEELLNILFLQSDYNIPDAIGLRVFTNFEHRAPIEWYQQNVSNIGAPSSINVGGYSGLQEGRTTYVNAANNSNDNIYTNMFVLSYTQGANGNTQDIFSQLYNNWTFNSNIDSYDSKSQLIRDTKRMENMITIADKLDDYYQINVGYPELEAGTYLAGTTVSVWDSWNNILGAQLGGLPIDPINEHSSCAAGSDPITCWNPTTLNYDCRSNSHVYIYDYVDSEYYVYSNFEYDNVIWKGEFHGDDVPIYSNSKCDSVILNVGELSSDLDGEEKPAE
ncbi:IPT/TIG domain-containing protein [Patescibacteria group bacterium]|nr:IPT/TIG domain-containing protein [Patescibacteria group bacterium]